MIHGRSGEVAAKDASPQEKTISPEDLDKEVEEHNPDPPPVVQDDFLDCPMLVRAQAPATASDKQTYLQFWFTTSFSSSTIQVRAAATSVSVPYGTASCWPRLFSRSACTISGSYDSRMDVLIMAPTVPTTLTRIVRFKEAFLAPPKVAVWLTGLCATPGAAVSVKAVANNISKTEFVLEIFSGDGAALASVGAAWAVWPDDVELAKVGTVITVKPGGARVPVSELKGKLDVGGSAALVALCAVDLVLAGGLWLEVTHRTDQWPPKYLRWVMTVGPADATVYSATLAYATE